MCNPLRFFKILLGKGFWLALVLALWGGAAWASPGERAPMKTEGLERLAEGPLEVWYPAGARKAAVNVLEDGQVHRARIWRALGLVEEAPVRVLLLDDLNEYFARRGQGARAPHWAVGLAISADDTILLKWGKDKTGAWAKLDETLAHELAHIGLDRATDDHGEHIDGQDRVTGSAGRRVPRWLHEGFAISQAHEWTLERETALLEASLTGELMPLQALHDGFPADGPRVELAYAEGFHFVRHLHESWGELAFTELTRHLREGDGFEAAFAQTYGRRFVDVESRWRDDLNVAYTWIPLLTGSSVFWGIGGVLFLMAWRRKRALTLERREAMEREEAQERGRVAQIPLPGLGLTEAHTRPRALQGAPWGDDAVLVQHPYLCTREPDPETPCTREGHPLH
jgi:hypothetical protein